MKNARPRYTMMVHVSEGRGLFMNGDFTLGRWISILYRYGQSFVSRELAPYNIGGGQYVFLTVQAKRHQPGGNIGVRSHRQGNHGPRHTKTDAGRVRRAADGRERQAGIQGLHDQKALDIEPVLWETARKWNKRISEGLTDEEKQAAR